VEETMSATLMHGGHHRNDDCFVFELEGAEIRRVREYSDTQLGEYWFATPRNPDGSKREPVATDALTTTGA
jgi:ketosteroid isomerase-like protein